MTDYTRCQRCGYAVARCKCKTGPLVERTAEVEPGETLMTPAEVAGMFKVDPKTIARWAKAGRIASIRTLGGHRRFREAEVRALLRGKR